MKLPHLGEARRAYRTIGFVERKATLVPFEPAVRDDAAGLSFQIVHHVLVLDLEHDAGGQHLRPVRSQLFVGTIVEAEAE